MQFQTMQDAKMFRTLHMLPPTGSYSLPPDDVWEVWRYPWPPPNASHSNVIASKATGSVSSEAPAMKILKEIDQCHALLDSFQGAIDAHFKEMNANHHELKRIFNDCFLEPTQFQRFDDEEESQWKWRAGSTWSRKDWTWNSEETPGDTGGAGHVGTSAASADTQSHQSAVSDGAQIGKEQEWPYSDWNADDRSYGEESVSYDGSSGRNFGHWNRGNGSSSEQRTERQSSLACDFTSSANRNSGLNRWQPPPRDKRGSGWKGR
eukprot:s3063_g8.t1